MMEALLQGRTEATRTVQPASAEFTKVSAFVPPSILASYLFASGF
jgi:hypothetical protein